MIKHVRTAFFTTAAALALGISLAMAAQNAATPAAVKAVTGAAPANLAAETYEVDPVHSSVVFKITHMGVSPFYGRFNGIDGTWTYHPDSPEDSSFEISVKTDTVDTHNPRRDGHLKSPDFFNASEYPKITFKSTKVEATGEDTLRVTGDLSLHGKTKSITADLKLVGRQDTGRMGFRSGFGTEFTIKRTDFGMDTYVAEGGLSDEVTLMIGLEGARK